MEPHSTSKLVPVSPTGSLDNYVLHLSDRTPFQEAHALVKTVSMRSTTMVLENSAEPNHLLTRLVAKTMDSLILLPTSQSSLLIHQMAGQSNQNCPKLNELDHKLTASLEPFSTEMLVLASP